MAGETGSAEVVAPERTLVLILEPGQFNLVPNFHTNEKPEDWV